MAQQAPRRGILELRRMFGTLTDQAAGLIASHQVVCECGEGAHAASDQDLNAMINDLMPIRQWAGGCTCGPPYDGTDVDDDLSDEALEAMLARLTRQYNLLHEEVQAAPCDCPDKSETPEVPELPVPRLRQIFMGLPEEVRSMIWWDILAPTDGIVRIIPQTLQPGQDSRIGGRQYHRERFEVQGRTVPPPATVPHRETWRRRGEVYEFPFINLHPRGNYYNLLLVNEQVYEEAEAEFWRRAVTERLMFSFGPNRGESARWGRPKLDYTGYDGILSAYTFFMTILRENPQYLRHIPGADYLRLIRRLHLDLTDTREGATRQALASVWQQGQTNAIQYLDDLLDIIHRNLTGLQELSLTFRGWVPDFSQTPWREGPPQFGVVPPPPPQSSRHWVMRLLNFRRRPLTRLRLRVTFYLPNNPRILEENLPSHPEVIRTARFITDLRRDMLVNGSALGGRWWRVWRFWDGDPTNYWKNPRVVVECDDSWDANTGTHAHHVGNIGYGPK